METCPMLWMWWMTQNTYWILTAWMRMTVKVKPKPKMKCVGRMGHMAIDSPHRCRCVFWFVFVVPTTPWRMGGFFGCIRVFFVCFLEHWCVCGMCFPPK